MGREVVWLRVPIAVAAGGEGRWILNLDYALLRRVDVYALIEGKVARHALLGDSQPCATRPLQGRTHALPIDFTAGSSVEIVVRADTPGGTNLAITMSRLPAFHSRP